MALFHDSVLILARAGELHLGTTAKVPPVLETGAGENPRANARLPAEKQGLKMNLWGQVGVAAKPCFLLFSRQVLILLGFINTEERKRLSKGHCS